MRPPGTILVIQLPTSRPDQVCRLVAPSAPGLLGGALGAGLEAEHATPGSLRHGLEAARVLAPAKLVHSLGRYVVGSAGQLVQQAGGVVGGQDWRGEAEKQRCARRRLADHSHGVSS